MLRAAAAAVAVLAAFFGVMYVRFSGDTIPVPEPEPTTSPAAAASTPSSPTPTVPDILAGVAIIPLDVGPPVDLPENVALTIETGCWGCAGWPGGLIRVYRRPDASIARDTLLDPVALGVTSRQLTQPDGTAYELGAPITGYAISPSGAHIVASICSRGGCAGDEGEAWDPESQTVFFRSLDAGITWSRIGTLDVAAQVVGLLPDERVLVRTLDGERPVGASSSYRVFPDLTVVEPPPIEHARIAAIMLDGEVLWLDANEDKLLRSDGSAFVDLKGSGRFDYDPVTFGSEGLSVEWTSYLFFDTQEGTFALERSFLSRVSSDGRIGETFQYDHTARFGLEITGTTQMGNASFDPKDYPDWNWFPSIFDTSSRQVRPVLNPFDGHGRNLVAAVRRGPFARVVNTEGTCLYIRTEPGSGGQVLDCAAEGVLLTDLGPFEFVEGATWMRVRTPAGVEGWASVNYLEAGARS